MARTPDGLGYTPVSVNLRDWKHSRQNTGRPCVGLNGTVVSLPHAEQLVVVSTRSRPIAAAGRGPRRSLRLARLASFRLVLEILVGEEELLAGRPDELRAAVHAVAAILSWNSIGPPSHAIPLVARAMLERERPARPRRMTGRRLPAAVDYSTSRRCFLRVRFRASACFARRRSPGFK